MSNFVKTFLKGQSGSEIGLYLGEGLKSLNDAIKGLQKGRLYYIASPPKTGKTTLVNYAFILNPLLDAIKRNINIKYYYYSLELTRIDLEFDFVTYFLYSDFKIKEVEVGNKKIELSPDFLRGRVFDDEMTLIKVPESIQDKMKFIYKNKIIPLFGEYNEEGIKIKDGYINVIETSDNPTGIFNFILSEAEKYGNFIEKKYGESLRKVGYIPNNPNDFKIVIFDHIRKVYSERGFDEKRSIDKLSEYFVILKRLLNWSFVGIVHLNRSLIDIQRFKQFGDMLFPDSDMVKASGNMAEDCDYLITMFNPNDERYNLKRHFGKDIKDMSGNPYFPNMRTIHLVESRHCVYPQHFKVNMLGNVKDFQNFNK